MASSLCRKECLLILVHYEHHSFGESAGGSSKIELFEPIHLQVAKLKPANHYTFITREASYEHTAQLPARPEGQKEPKQSLSSF